MTSILDTITAHKKKEVIESKQQVTIEMLKKNQQFLRNGCSLKKNLQKGPVGGIIAEHKRQSPSKGVINNELSLEKITSGYVSAGAAGLSVLTDGHFFGGTRDDLSKARSLHPQIPILRKDFIVDAYQIYESKAWGADVILLIAACLSPQQVLEYTEIAHDLGLEVLLEVHDSNELESNRNADVDMVGVNNRNLKTFEVSLQPSVALADKIPDRFIKITESGLNSAKDIVYLSELGYRGFLIGESFMKTSDPGKACKELWEQVLEENLKQTAK